MLQQVAASSPGDEGSDEDVGVEDESQETRSNTSSSVKTPLALAAAIIRARRARKRLT
jgi:hypothetical protein